MKLDEFLKALESCPDGELKEELGIYDNWPIFLKADFDHVFRCMEQDRTFEYLKERSREFHGFFHFFYYAHGTVYLQIMNGLWDINCSLRKGEDDKLQSRGYRTTITFHPYQDRKMEGVNYLRAMAMAVADVSRLIIRERIPICVPRTLGCEKYRDTEEFPRKVYYRPRLPLRTRK